MSPIPVYRVISMEASKPSVLYNYEITLQVINESESNDLANGFVSEFGYDDETKITVNVTEDVFHSLRIGMIYQIAFAPANLKEVA
jgi:hypothetical protein